MENQKTKVDYSGSSREEIEKLIEETAKSIEDFERRKEVEGTGGILGADSDKIHEAVLEDLREKHTALQTALDQKS